MREKIWNLRDYIYKIEDIKEETINYLNHLEELDDTTKELWLSDVKELFHNIISAWELLKPNSELERNYFEESKSYLYVARNCLSKIISELNIFENNKSKDLIDELKNGNYSPIAFRKD